MAQTGYTPIQIYSSSTASQVPLAVNLTNNTLGSELAINITDGKLYYKDNGGTVQLLASKAGASGDVVGPASATDNAVARFDLTTGKLIQNSVVTIGDTGDVTGVAALTASGNVTLSGGTANGVLYLNGSKVATSGSNLTYNGTDVTLVGGVYGGSNGSGATGYVGPVGTSWRLVNLNASSSTDIIGNGTINIQTAGGSPIILTTNGSERMRIDSSGNVGIGTSSPGAKLEVVETNLANIARMVRSTTTTNALQGALSVQATSTGTVADNFGPSVDFNIAGSGLSVTRIGRVGAMRSGADNKGALVFFIANAADPIERMRLDSSGNLGLGVTPSAWGSTFVAIQMAKGSANTASLSQQNNGNVHVVSNAYNDDTNWKYTNSNYAAAYGLGSYGAHYWFTAPLGTAGNTITFTQAMTLDASGNLGIGTATPTTGTLNRQLTINSGASNLAGIVLQNNATGTAYNDGTTINILNGTDFQIFNQEAGYMMFGTNNAERMRLDSSGNLGLGVTPSAWTTSFQIKALQVGPRSALAGSGSNTSVADNNYYDGTNSRYITNSFASYYLQDSGQHIWYTAPSGTAGNAITFTQAMTLDASGNLGIGTTSPGASTKLNVSGRGLFTGGLDDPSDGTASGVSISYNTSSNIGIVAAIQTGFAERQLRLRGSVLTFNTGGDVERLRIHASGGVSIGNTTDPGAANLLVTGSIGAGNVSPTALLTLAAGTATANTGPLKFTSGTNLTTPEAGAVEYDGTVMTATSNTSFKRGTIPLTNYVSGAGTNLGTNTETTLQNLLPAANDTITLPSGTYFLDMAFTVTRTGNSTTSATARLNILGGGNAAGNFTGMSISAIIAGGAANNFSFSAVNINTSNVLTAASATNGGVYTMTLRGMLKITTAGTIVPQYNLSATLGTGAAGGASVSVLYMRLQQIDSQNNTTVGPAGTGWA